MCCSHQNMTNVGGGEENFRAVFARDVSSFSRERLPFGRRTRTTQEKPISESYEVTAPRDLVTVEQNGTFHFTMITFFIM